MAACDVIAWVNISSFYTSMNAIALFLFFFSNLIQLILMPRASQLVKVLLTQVKKEVEEDEPKWKHKLSKCDANQTQLADKAVTGLINLPPPPVKELLQASQTRPVSLGGQYVKALYVTVKCSATKNIDECLGMKMSCSLSLVVYFP